MNSGEPVPAFRAVRMRSPRPRAYAHFSVPAPVPARRAEPFTPPPRAPERSTKLRVGGMALALLALALYGSHGMG